MPQVGLVRSGFMFGMVNVAVALWLLYRFGDKVRHASAHKAAGLLVLLGLLAGFAFGHHILGIAEGNMFPDQVIYSTSTPYQRIIITKAPHDLRLFLNNNLQFSSRDKYRYHEALVHPGLASVPDPRHVLILGGGDGLAAREVLKYASVEDVTLVDLDPSMTRLFSNNELLSSLNQHVFSSPKMHVINADAFLWMKEHLSELSSKGRLISLSPNFPIRRTIHWQALYPDILSACSGCPV